MKTIYKFIVSGIYCLAVLSLQAQDPLILSLDSAVSYAIGHNKTLVNSKFAIDKSTQKLRETIAAGLPQINASMDYNNFLGAQASLQLNPAAPPAIIEFNPTSSFKANVSQLVFNGNYFVGIELSKLAKTITEQSYQKDELNVKEQTIQAYCMILASERILVIIRSNKENALLIYDKTKNLANAGIIEQTDVKKLSVMVASVDNALKSMQRQVELGYNLLRFQLGLNSDQAISLASNLDDISRQFILHSSLAESFNIQNNIDFKLISMQGDIAQKTIKMRKSSYLPTLAAYYSRTDKILKPLFDFTPKNVVGLTLNVPILSGGQRLAQLNQARIDSDISTNTKELLTQQLTLQERQFGYNYYTLLVLYDTQKAIVEIAKEVLDKMNLKYQQGIISSLEVTSANNDYLTAESNFTNLILQLLNAEMTLRKINSKL
ncbi:MAG: TolC family protein [Bacteroidia bacterium]|nr:TolC family protein [Bacteroidia bacterium]